MWLKLVTCIIILLDSTSLEYLIYADHRKSFHPFYSLCLAQNSYPDQPYWYAAWVGWLMARLESSKTKQGASGTKEPDEFNRQKLSTHPLTNTGSDLGMWLQLRCFFSIPPWKIPWTEEPDAPRSMVLQSQTRLRTQILLSQILN